jgi:plasmid maintenance system antidote protein VapI
VQLSDAYRAIYTIRSEGRVEAVYVEEVNKHDYSAPNPTAGERGGQLEKLMGSPLTSGGALSALRESEGETLSQFAERLSVTRMHSSDIEHGRRTVSLGRAGKFATVLGPSQEQFVRLALQDQVRDAGLNLRVEVHAA